MSDTVLHVENLTKVYKTNRKSRVNAVQGVTFTLTEGRVLGLVGESGSGKTTIGRLMCGIELPTTGQILLHSREGRDVLSVTRKTDHQKIQMVFQDPYASLNPFNTVEYTVSRPLINYLHVSAREAKSQARDIMNAVKLTPAEDFLVKRPDQLSGGQRQRVVIARALAAGPEVIVADEPVSMLDVSIRAEVISLLQDLRESGRVRAMLYITHDLLSARQLADEIMVLYKGKVVEHGLTGQILGQPQHPYSRILLAAIPNPRRPLAASVAGVQSTVDERPPAQGCSFAPRCPLVGERCLTQAPKLLIDDDGRAVACHAVHATA